MTDEQGSIDNKLEAIRHDPIRDPSTHVPRGPEQMAPITKTITGVYKDFRPQFMSPRNEPEPEFDYEEWRRGQSAESEVVDDAPKASSVPESVSFLENVPNLTPEEVVALMPRETHSDDIRGQSREVPASVEKALSKAGPSLPTS